MRASGRGLLLLLVAVLALGVVDAGSAAARRPAFVAKKLPGYCGTVTPVYGPPVGLSVSSSADRWKRTSAVSCRKARKVARSYIRNVVKHGQGSGGYLKVGRFRCNSINVDTAEATGHSATCQSRRAVISFDTPPYSTSFVYPCTAKRLSVLLRSQFAGTGARMVNHRCARATAVAKIVYRGKVLRYAFFTEDGYWGPVRVNRSVLAGLSSPSVPVNLSTVNALGRAMGGKRVEKYRVGR